jgi:CubicO group peptidase (beta-lactamase class C family)
MNEAISAFLSKRIAENDFPSAVYLLAEKGEIVFQDAIGCAVVEPERIEASLDTIYDLASLTKPLVSGFLAARLLENSELGVEDLVSDYFAEFQNRYKKTTVKELATHTSGMRDWLPFYVGAGNLLTDFAKREPLPLSSQEINKFVLNKIAQEPPSKTTKNQVIYSDLNFLLLGFLIELIDGMPLHAIYSNSVIAKLRLMRTFFGELQVLRREIAASEKGNEYEKQTCIEQGYLKPPVTPGGSDMFRDYQIWGEVHDGNAWFMGGVAGHAGLFSTAEEVFKIALQFLPNHTKLLKPETCKLFCTNFTNGLNEDRSFAFQLASTEGSTAGTRMSPESFGHNGFTGTSLWIDPVKDRIFVLLTNRTHNHPLPFVNINSVRRKFHDLAIDHLEGR